MASDLDYLHYRLTVEVEGPNGARRELGVITAQLPFGMVGTEVLSGLAAMLDAAAVQIDRRTESDNDACYTRVPASPGVGVHRSVDNPPI